LAPFLTTTMAATSFKPPVHQLTEQTGENKHETSLSTPGHEPTQSLPHWSPNNKTE
jgi:hypothetical protein